MQLYAGTGCRDITPDGSSFLCGYPHVERLSTGVHDPLQATALCLTSGGRSALILSLDILFVSPAFARQLRQDLAAATGIEPACVFVGCTHTHSGPPTCEVLEWGPSPEVPAPDPAYLRKVHDQAVEAALGATRIRRPAEAAWGIASIDGVGGNRHDPEGPHDPEAGLLLVRAAGARDPLGMLLVYSMHPTVLHEDSRLVSSDFPHYARVALKECLGPQTAIVYLTGPAGDQSPRHHVRSQTFAEAERLGRRLGTLAAERAAALADAAFSPALTLDGILVPTSLPHRRFPPVDQARALVEALRARHSELIRTRAPRPAVRTAECDVFGAEEALYLAMCAEDGRLARVLAAYESLDVQVLRLGDGFLCGFPGEVFIDYGLALKREAPPCTFVATLVNGDTQGYIVTPQAVRERWYESNNCVFAPEAGPALVRAALEGIGALRSRAEAPRR